MTSQGQTCVDTPILDTLRLPVTDHVRRVAARVTCTEFPVNDLGGADPDPGRAPHRQGMDRHRIQP